MEIACLHCGFFRATPDGARAAASEPCPRCSERAKLLGGAEALAAETVSVTQESKREWHIMLRGLQRGPYTRESLAGLLATHAEGWGAEVWRAGMAGWQPAQEVDALLQAQRPASPPAAPSTAARASREASVSSSEAWTATQPLANLHKSRRSSSRAAGETTLRLQAVAPTEHTSLLQVALGASLAFAAAAAYLWFNPLTHAASATTPPPPVPRVAARVRADLRSRAEPRASTPALPAQAALKPALPAVAAPAQVPDLPVQMAAPSAPSAQAAPPLLAPAARPSPEPLIASDRAEPTVPLRVRVRAAWAPIRATTSADGRVVCSLPRGTELAVSQQAPGNHGRWFEVHCDTNTAGWVHENHLAWLRHRR
jgi:hypothetical protein